MPARKKTEIDLQAMDDKKLREFIATKLVEGRSKQEAFYVIELFEHLLERKIAKALEQRDAKPADRTSETPGYRSHDNNGVEYAKLYDLNTGDEVRFDNDFDCGIGGKILTLQIDPECSSDGAPWSELYVECGDHDKHYINGQMQEGGDHLIGIYQVGDPLAE